MCQCVRACMRVAVEGRCRVLKYESRTDQFCIKECAENPQQYTHTHGHTHTHTCTHARTHACTHTNTQLHFPYPIIIINIEYTWPFYHIHALYFHCSCVGWEERRWQIKTGPHFSLKGPIISQLARATTTCDGNYLQTIVKVWGGGQYNILHLHTHTHIYWQELTGNVPILLHV